MERQRTLPFREPDPLAAERALEAAWGPTLDALDETELARLTYAAYNGEDWAGVVVRKLGRNSRIVRHELLAQLAKESERE